jgi:hypothetical protein
MAGCFPGVLAAWIAVKPVPPAGWLQRWFRLKNGRADREAWDSMTVSITTREYRRLPRETETERTIREVVGPQARRIFSVRDSLKLDVEDMPELIIVSPPYLALWELKSQRR